MEKIKEIICPSCRKNLMYLKYEHLPGISQRIPSKYVCPNCVITYQYEWFDRFIQYEFLVLRVNSTIKQFEKWLDNLEVDKKVMNRMKSKLIKNGRKTFK